MSTKKLFQLLALLAMLVGFPLISWYYLKTGLDYRMEKMGELADRGQLPDFQYEALSGNALSSQLLANQLLVGYLSNGAGSDASMKAFKRLHQQFDERNEVFFLHFCSDTSLATAQQLLQSAQVNQLADTSQWFQFQLSTSEVGHLAKAVGLPYADYDMSIDQNTLFFLADSLQVRAYYDFTKEEDLKRLVEHIALNLPVQKSRQELIFKRDKEK
ncbi:MAG TPA: hypothetical protein PKA00_19185 [Saprospiraceae bacterium]|nr:hypothetical protein [Saprospiraceae bacterium]HMQ85042.1 hypothetical protein [Saprospiraceae bacterium]